MLILLISLVSHLRLAIQHILLIAHSHMVIVKFEPLRKRNI